MRVSQIRRAVARVGKGAFTDEPVTRKQEWFDLLADAFGMRFDARPPGAADQLQDTASLPHTDAGKPAAPIDGTPVEDYTPIDPAPEGRRLRHAGRRGGCRASARLECTHELLQVDVDDRRRHRRGGAGAANDSRPWFAQYLVLSRRNGPDRRPPVLP